MKHIFMVNRFSLRERLDRYVTIIENVAKRLKLDYVMEINDDNNTTENILSKYKKNNDIVYAVGGDGIINRVINSMYGTKNKVACIPAGTGNDFNRSINEFFNDGDNLVDLIKCNNQYLINVACWGADADIANDNKIVHNKYIPRSLQYKVGVIKELIIFKPYTMTLKWDKESRTSKLGIVTVCNGSYYGGGFHINGEGIYNDGLMDVYIINATNRRQIISYLLKLLKGKPKDSKYTEHIRTDNFTIITENPIEGNLDGESLLSTKFEMKIIPKAITFYYNKKLIEEINKELGA